MPYMLSSIHLHTSVDLNYVNLRACFLHPKSVWNSLYDFTSIDLGRAGGIDIRYESHSKALIMCLYLPFISAVKPLSIAL